MKKGAQMQRRVTIAASVMGVILFACAIVSAQSISIRDRTTRGYLPVVQNGRAIPIVVANADHQVVKLAAKDLASDIEKVTGKLPVIGIEPKTLPPNAIIIGTLGRNYLIEQIVSAGKLDVRGVRGKWETFVIATVKNPLPGIASALVIVGSDRRGTAFGVYEFSQMLGVSPWNWWADVTPDKRAEIHVSPGKLVSREPSVKYRGIFLNDEDWGLQPWAAKTFEPETGDIGPKTYAKIFELLLRLKANTLWPAMHEVTRPFNSIPGNKKVADDYAIVMGSSHAEPMLRNNVGEWKANKDDFNFVTNRTLVTEYWDKRVSENARYENIYTIGMRGIHDSPILGTKTQAERIPLLEKIFSVQRGMLRKYTGRTAENIPQIFCPYKEVLADYRAGLKVPDDVTIVFPDDNFGYIRQFPTAEERKRKGGFGVYYHISYLGRPLSYLWLNTTPPALIWQEMSKAYANGMRDLWIVNVGDIKPGEIGMEFFLQMAYDANRWTVDTQQNYFHKWAAREFGDENAAAIADIMAEFYRLGFERKPEHLQWYLVNETKRKSDLTEDETLARLVRYDELVRTTEDVERTIPRHKQAAFYQLVLYPVRVSKHTNERFFGAELAERNKTTWPADAHHWARRSVAADEAIAKETLYYNQTLSNGKWRGMMSPEMGPGQWPSMRAVPPKVSLDEFPAAEGSKPISADGFAPVQMDLSASDSLFREFRGAVAIEAENFRMKTDVLGFGWRTIRGLGKTGDCVSVFPNVSKSFTGQAPSIEYEIDVDGGGYTVEFYLLPTQPLVTGRGLRLAFAIDDEEPQVVIADADAEVSSRKWAANILDQNTRAIAKRAMTRGKHRLRVFAVDTGVVLDKLVLYQGDLPTSYFGPAETRSLRTKK
ncbi:MAG: glycosyl hydrolase 115 family protein [Pyrinomonadaceae bacterium]